MSGSAKTQLIDNVATVSTRNESNEPYPLENYLRYLNPEMHDQGDKNCAKAIASVEDFELSRSKQVADSSDCSVSIKPKNILGCDNSTMFLRTSDQSGKKLCCPFCEKLYSKLARHMEAKHSEEVDVKKFLSLPKGSKDKRAIQDALRKIGQTNFNKNAVLNNGELITSRRPNPKNKRKAVDNTTCPYCVGSYAKSGLHFHYYDRVVEAIRSVARVDEIRNEFIAPNTATSAVTAIKQIGEMLVVQYIRRGDHKSKWITRDFLTVLNCDMCTSINKMATETKSRKARPARHKTVILPSSEDVKILAQYIETERIKCFTELSESYTFKNWLRLNELTMASIIVFNRRRVGDTQNILAEDYAFKEVINESTNEELFSDLPEHSKKIASQYSRMKVRGKRNRTVPVLLKANVDDCLMSQAPHFSSPRCKRVSGQRLPLRSTIQT
ncbi:hypothetical protein Bhyg_12196 [Pseudolycoriella hygida]|uniref:Uncharacterized protein n=1 Tax=Pseudolycoriella hygida TaxID=35572 RepID=A0A9Q0S0M6_9DIPT|nr:hypothetical protein Bhyg_12196 [Pseudolycoriella hygida]